MRPADDDTVPDSGRSWQEAAPRVDAAPTISVAVPSPRTPLDAHIATLERAEHHLIGRVHAQEHSADADRAREIHTRLRNVRARLAEARAERARIAGAPG